MTLAKKPNPKYIFKIGERFKTKNFGDIEIVEYRDCYNVMVKFTDGTIVSARTTNIKTGEVRNPNQVTIFNRGFYGIGVKLPTKSREYVMWLNMFHRCYSGKYPSYQGVEVCKEWYNFQNFVKWLHVQPNWDNKDFALDKDVKCMGNLLYSPETCTIIPKQLNCLFTSYGHNRKFKDITTGVTLSSCRRYFQVQWSDNKHRCKYFTCQHEAKNYWVTLKRQKVVLLIDKYSDYIDAELKELMLNYDWYSR